MKPITPKQRLAVAEAGDAPIVVLDLQSGDEFALVRAEVYHKMRNQLEDDHDQEAWAKVARNAREQWARRNPF